MEITIDEDNNEEAVTHFLISNMRLHFAIDNNDMNEFRSLLHEPNINLNYQDEDGDTPLLVCLMESSESTIIMARLLIEAGCDINLANNCMNTPLHAAMWASFPVDIVDSLMRKGADLNALNMNGLTPLNFAVINHTNLENISLLLYHGASFHTVISNNVSLMLLISLNQWETAAMLIRYCHDFSGDDAAKALYLAALKKNPIAIDLVKAGVNVNYVYNGSIPLVLSCSYLDATLFKLIWRKTDYDVLLKSDQLFLLTYLNISLFSTEEWLECIYLLLKCPVAFNLVQHFINYDKSKCRSCINEHTTMSHLLSALYNKNVQSYDRIAIIFIFLSLGAELNMLDMHCLFSWYGFNEELEVSIYTGNFSFVDNPTSFIRYILALETDSYLNDDIILKLLSNPTGEFGLDYVLRFFSQYSPYSKKLMIRYCAKKGYSQILEKLENMPNIPSLLELSRNSVRQYIKLTFRISKPYQFHDAVKSLDLPQGVEDVIRFKKPIYLGS